MYYLNWLTALGSFLVKSGNVYLECGVDVGLKRVESLNERRKGWGRKKWSKYFSFSGCHLNGNKSVLSVH